MPDTFTPLPTITKTLIADRSVETVDARKVHAYLEVGRDFSNWIKDRIASYGFAEGEDFTVFAGLGENPSGGRPTKEYALTLDMAKELAMVERSPKGRAIRRYFLRCERKALERVRRPLSGKAEDRAIKRVREARLTLGTRAAQEVWRTSGLEIPDGFERPEQPDLLDGPSGSQH